MVAYRVHAPMVGGSIPSPATIYAGIDKWSKSSPFHGGVTGSNPVAGTNFKWHDSLNSEATDSYSVEWECKSLSCYQKNKFYYEIDGVTVNHYVQTTKVWEFSWQILLVITILI